MQLLTGYLSKSVLHKNLNGGKLIADKCILITQHPRDKKVSLSYEHATQRKIGFVIHLLPK